MTGEFTTEVKNLKDNTSENFIQMFDTFEEAFNIFMGKFYRLGIKWEDVVIDRQLQTARTLHKNYDYEILIYRNF